jgi:hypothetical protein
MDNCRPENLAGGRKRFIHGTFRNIYPRDATVLSIYQHDTHNPLVKPLVSQILFRQFL